MGATLTPDDSYKRVWNSAMFTDYAGDQLLILGGSYSPSLKKPTTV